MVRKNFFAQQGLKLAQLLGIIAERTTPKLVALVDWIHIVLQ